MNIEQTVPNRRSTGSARSPETVGTGDASTTTFYTDKAYITEGSYTFYYGPSIAGGTAMVAGTDYNLDKDTGVLTLTSTGVTSVGTESILGVYSFNDAQITDTQLQLALDMAQAEIDDRTNNHWASGSDATPDYKQVTDEKHTGKGRFDRDYFLDNFPLPDVKTNVAVAAVVGATSLALSDTDGFLNGGYVGVDDNKIVYTGKDTTQHILLGCSGIASAITAGATAVPYVVELSTTDSGTRPTWSVLTVDADFDMDTDTGKVHIFKTDYDLTYYALQYPPRLIPNRFRCTYIWGSDSIPDDIKNVTLAMAARNLIRGTARRNLLHGKNMSRIENVNVDDEWIMSTLDRLSSVHSSNT